MSKAEETESGWRGSPEVWLGAAYDVLIENGVDSVKILSLARRLKLSRTSFYWFFEDREALLASLADLWEARTTRHLTAAAHAYAETPAEAMLNVIACFLSETCFDARMEFAVRGWALQDAGMLARLHAADTTRLASLAAMLERFGYSREDADVRSRAIYLVQIGYISMQTEETLETRLARVPGYVEIYTGRPPTGSEQARFEARIREGRG